MEKQKFLVGWHEDVSPMSRALFEGLNGPPPFNPPYIGFDIETYSPNGFPRYGEDPVVAATLAISDGDPRKGLLLLSLIHPPSREETLLAWLHSFLYSCQGSCLVTYNGAQFDLRYVVHRGRMYGIDFENAFSNCKHMDLYEVIRKARLQLQSYGQKTVERFIGINRVVNDMSGASYHTRFDEFLRFGNLKPLFYNVEDSVGCLHILKALMIAEKAPKS